MAGGTTKLCTVPGCDKPHRARGWCSAHWERWKRWGSVEIPDDKVRREQCVAPDCTRKAVRGKGDKSLCEGHYMRMRRNGSYGDRPIGCLPPKIPTTVLGPKLPPKVCGVEECNTVATERGYCKKHATRLRRHGDPTTYIPHEDRNLPTRSDNPRWTGDMATSEAVHQRLRKWRGPASTHRCVECGEQAAHWSYNHDAPDERIAERGAYTTDLSYYSPRCVPCHKRFDLDYIKRRLNGSEDQAEHL